MKTKTHDIGKVRKVPEGEKALISSRARESSVEEINRQQSRRIRADI
ncbi:hypothetical protein J5S49_03955 [Virgibacillus halodenitrificans]|nr:hypothetical protein [Virgibacillus halodenitrificans]MCG1027438.1 hypothetical protein [Virgibacillus halodenitrificans]